MLVQQAYLRSITRVGQSRSPTKYQTTFVQQIVWYIVPNYNCAQMQFGKQFQTAFVPQAVWYKVLNCSLKMHQRNYTVPK